MAHSAFVGTLLSMVDFCTIISLSLSRYLTFSCARPLVRSSCDVVLTGGTISSRHCIIKNAGDGMLLVEDLR